MEPPMTKQVTLLHRQQMADILLQAFMGIIYIRLARGMSMLLKPILSAIQSKRISIFPPNSISVLALMIPRYASIASS